MTQRENASMKTFRQDAKMHCIDLFGKSPDQMNEEELLYAISIVAQKLHNITNEGSYDNVKEVASHMLASKGKGKPHS